MKLQHRIPATEESETHNPTLLETKFSILIRFHVLAYKAWKTVNDWRKPSTTQFPREEKRPIHYPWRCPIQSSSLLSLRSQKTLFRDINLPAEAIVPDLVEITSTWADVGVGQNQGQVPSMTQCILLNTRPKDQLLSTGFFNLFYNSLTKQIHLDKCGYLSLIWECKKCLTWQKLWMLM